MKTVKLLCLTSVAALTLGVTAVMADDTKVGFGAGDILVHARALGAFTQVDGNDTALNGKVEVGNSYVPEVDASYFFTDHFAVEAIAGTTHHQVRDKLASGTKLDLGDVWLLPPTITAQYHPLAHNVWDPYVGVGLNYSIFYGAGGAQTIAPGKSTEVHYADRFGVAFDAGVNYDICDSWFVNLDVKKLYVTTEAKVLVGGAEVTRASVNLNPWLVGLGVGYRF